MTGEFLTSLTPEHKKFLVNLFKDGVSFDPKVLRVYASDASLLTGTVLAMVRPESAGQLCEFMRCGRAPARARHQPFRRLRAHGSRHCGFHAGHG